MRDFLAELRRRNVYKVGAAYAVVGWIALQAASFLLPSFGAPAWVLRVVILLVFVGFVLALAFAWAFELTPEGLRRTHEVPQEHSITHVTGRKLDFTIIGLLVFALGISVYLNLREAPHGKRQASIAVLPFTSRSVDPAHAMFADGVHDELLTSLANIGSLKVISRRFLVVSRYSITEVREIGKELAVATVLEGAVQRAGDNVRINVQLIDAATDEHLWANTYDRRLSTDNIFAIQTEIATTIAEKLKAALTSDEKERIAKVPTANLEAYKLYLAARQNLYQRKLESLRQARTLFEQAIKLDPVFAQAYAGLSDTLNILYSNYGAIEPDEALPESRALLDKAIALDPDDADIHASIGLAASTRWDLTQSREDLAAAERSFQRALELSPNHAQVLAWYAGQELFSGKYAHAIELFERSLALDPLARISQLNLGECYAAIGEHRKALDTWLASVRMNPDWAVAMDNIGQHLLDLGRLDEALAWGNKALALSADPTQARSAGGSYGALGQVQRSVELLRRTPQDHPFRPLRQALALHIEGDGAAGLALLQDTIKGMDYPPAPYLYVATDLALLQGRYAEARGYIEKICPRMQDAAPGFDDFGFCSAPAYGLALKRLGNEERARQVLEAYLAYVDTRPRLGLKGYAIRDVESLALLGRPERALQRLREAVNAGWRTDWHTHGWQLAADPYLAGLREDARFRAIVVEVDADIERMRDSAARAEESGDWQPLFARASQGEGRGPPAPAD
jgi:TolB-like protein/Tfp pilus assembly protein PilF